MIKKLHLFAPLLAVLALPMGIALWAADSKPALSEDYRKEIEAFRKERNEGLKKEDGWLTLVGLFWLKPGENSWAATPATPSSCPKARLRLWPA